MEANLKRHINEKHRPNENHYQCGICKMSFNRKDNMLHHQRIQHNFDVKKVTLPGINDDQLTEICQFCEKSFKTKFTLKRHLETVHLQNSDVIFECKICRKVFRRKDKLQKHEKTHLVIEVEIQCDVCDKKFQSEDGLEAHKISCIANE